LGMTRQQLNRFCKTNKINFKSATEAQDVVID